MLFKLSFVWWGRTDIFPFQEISSEINCDVNNSKFITKEEFQIISFSHSLKIMWIVPSTAKQTNKKCLELCSRGYIYIFFTEVEKVC